MKKRVSVCLIFAFSITVLMSCGKAGNENGIKGENVGYLKEFEYSPGYSDMRGACHYESLRKNDKGEWVIISRDREDIANPTIVTTYAVSTESLSEFEAFLTEKAVISLADRKESNDFATDYSPWSFSIIYDKSSGGGNKRETYRIEEYKKYSDADYKLIEEIKQEFKALRGKKISETVDSE
ncbi:MAG: hypothetical protein K5770_08140 [Lachnospiraceae bacterium]|nr:hypothetical protein [Lachnospiraceae bacterium]